MALITVVSATSTLSNFTKQSCLHAFVITNYDPNYSFDIPSMSPLKFEIMWSHGTLVFPLTYFKILSIISMMQMGEYREQT